eukprot:c7210_g1_i1.p1 GENE.c7210_g1_i1~~c7210_g1_i1.p1  ORF type:complete len:190 (-),score=59.86 c7210_g1_i1:71-640(-)
MATEVLNPQCEWAQRADKLWFVIDLQDVENEHISIEGHHLSFSGRSHGKAYSVDLTLFGELKLEDSKWNKTGRRVEMLLTKKEKKWWDRLTKEQMKLHFIGVDWSRYKDEDEAKDDLSLDGAGMDFSQFGGTADNLDDMDADSDHAALPDVDDAKLQTTAQDNNTNTDGNTNKNDISNDNLVKQDNGPD